jgi:hypothetical protein
MLYLFSFRISSKKKFIDPRELVLKELKARYHSPYMCVLVRNNITFPVKVQFINEGTQVDTINIGAREIVKGDTFWEDLSSWKTIAPFAIQKFLIPVYYAAEKNFIAHYTYNTTFIRVRAVGEMHAYFHNKIVTMRDVVSHGAHYYIKYIKGDPETGLTAKREYDQPQNRTISWASA